MPASASASAVASVCQRFMLRVRLFSFVHHHVELRVREPVVARFFPSLANPRTREHALPHVTAVLSCLPASSSSSRRTESTSAISFFPNVTAGLRCLQVTSAGLGVGGRRGGWLVWGWGGGAILMLIERWVDGCGFCWNGVVLSCNGVVLSCNHVVISCMS